MTMARFERKVQQLESGLAFESKRRYLLLGMRDHILKVNPRVSLGDAYRYAELALQASEKYPAVDPLLLVAIGTVESGYDPQATSHVGARGLYQIWPSTGRLLRSLGWNYDEDCSSIPRRTRRPPPSTSTSSSPPTATPSSCWPNTTAVPSTPATSGPAWAPWPRRPAATSRASSSSTPA